MIFFLKVTVGLLPTKTYRGVTTNKNLPWGSKTYRGVQKLTVGFKNLPWGLLPQKLTVGLLSQKLTVGVTTTVKTYRGVTTTKTYRGGYYHKNLPWG